MLVGCALRAGVHYEAVHARARRDATATSFVDLLCPLAPYLHGHSFNMTSQGKHCLSADSEARRGEARRRRTVGA
jgi:hypothetical protein